MDNLEAVNNKLNCPRCGVIYKEMDGYIYLNCPRCGVIYKEMDGYIYGFCRECAKYILNQYAAN